MSDNTEELDRLRAELNESREQLRLANIDSVNAEAELAEAKQSSIDTARKMFQLGTLILRVERNGYRNRAEKAEAERDALRARLTGVAIHANRIANCIWPDTPVWEALADLRAALAVPESNEGLN